MLIKVVPLFLLLATTLCQDLKNVDLEAILEMVHNSPDEVDIKNTGETAADVTLEASSIVPPPSGNDGKATAKVVTDRTPKASTIVPFTVDEENLPCTTDDKEPGECVGYYLCNSINKTINSNGLGIINVRERDTVCSYLETCCRLSEQRPKDDPIMPTTPLNEEKREGCGWSNPQGVGGLTITGHTDGEAQFGEYPWMVAIFRFTPVINDKHFGQEIISYLGGGSLIHMKVVLTTAHYVANVTNLRVRAGEWDTQTTKETIPHQDRDVETVVVHKDFFRGTLFNDVALLFLKKPMDPAPNIGVICLPPPKQIQKERTKCFSSGWGKDKLGMKGRYQVILKKVDLPVVKNSECQRLLRKTHLGRRFLLDPSFMCAGGAAGRDTCKGDGGSPLVCPIEHQPDRFVQAGMVAWGINCGEDGIPGVYADVAAAREWIDEKMAAMGYGDEMVYAKY